MMMAPKLFFPAQINTSTGKPIYKRGIRLVAKDGVDHQGIAFTSADNYYILTQLARDAPEQLCVKDMSLEEKIRMAKEHKSFNMEDTKGIPSVRLSIDPYVTRSDFGKPYSYLEQDLNRVGKYVVENGFAKFVTGTGLELWSRQTKDGLDIQLVIREDDGDHYINRQDLRKTLAISQKLLYHGAKDLGFGEVRLYRLHELTQTWV